MANTPNLDIVLLSSGQNQKEVTVNEALVVIDAVLNNGVIDKDLTTPPVSPTDGDLYIVATGGTGAWSGHDADVAYYYSGWKFIDPKAGLLLLVVDEHLYYQFDGSSWKKTTMGIGEAMLDNRGNSAQFYINKNASGDTASFIFQKGYSGRAEFGLIGDDDFQLKVSPDGMSFVSAWKINKTTASVQFNKQIQFPTATDLTIASGAITITQSNHTVDTESSAASDDLDTISGLADWAKIILTSKNSGRAVVIKHNTGNIITKAGTDFTLSSTSKIFYGVYNPLISKVVEI